MIKAILIGAIAALATALFLQLLLPSVLGILAALLVSGLTILDPLYAADRLEAIWATLMLGLTIQSVQTFVISLCAGALVGYFATKIKTGWLYLAGATASTLLHYLLLIVLAGILSFITVEGNLGLVIGISAVLATIAGPIIGLTSTFAAKKWGI